MSIPSANQADLRLVEVKELLSGILFSDSVLNLIDSSVVRNIRVIENDIYVRLFHGRIFLGVIVLLLIRVQFQA
jgi:hypothetical protein